MEFSNGMFRGICVDNRDPKNLGRIRVQVPQILGTTTSGWAFPAWSFEQKMVWPVDRLPKAGDGVWVMFDSTSPDKMIWVAAFGPLDLINQPGFVENPDYTSTLTMILTGTPTWNTNVTFSGVLSSDGGVPNPNPKVYLNGRTAGGNWQGLGEAIPDRLAGGAWSLTHLVRLTGAVEYMAAFNGTGVFGAATSPVIKVNTPVVTFPTTTTIAMSTPSPAVGKTVTFNGTLTTGGSPPPGYGIPHPGAVVTLSSQQGSGAWAVVVGNIPVDPTTGAWSTPYTIALPGSVNYRANFAGKEIYLASQSSALNVNTSQPTTVSTPVLPTLTYGQVINVSGTVKVTATGASVTAGTIELWWKHTAGADQTWKKSSATANVTAGTYSLTSAVLATLGPTEWEVRYLGSSAYNATDSGNITGTINLPAMGVLTKGTLSHTSASFSWAAVAGATGYDVIQRLAGGAWSAPVNNTTRTYSATSLALDKTYEWMVRAKATDVAGTTVYDAYTPVLSAKTGHPAVTDSGTTGWVNIALSADDSWRNDGQDWGAVSDMRQGFFSTAYGGEGYTGAAIYKGATVRDAIIAACGNATRQANGTCTAAEISMTRLTAIGDYASGITMTFYYSTTLGSVGGKPDRLGTAVNRTAANVAAGATWYDIGTAHGQKMGDGVGNSVVIYRNTSADYAAFHASTLRLKWTWNYTSTALVSPVWV